MSNPTNKEQQSTVLMITDIASFSDKMARDERAAFELLKTYDTLMRGIAVQFGGKVVNIRGDIFIIQFVNPVESLRCAIEIQKRLWSFNLGKLDYESIQVRIGMHVGTAVVEQNKITGEGIESAECIEACTEPTRICISEDVYGLVKGRIEFRAFYMGSIALKSASGELKIYEVLIESIAEFAQPSERARQKLTKKSIAEYEKRRNEEVKEAELLEEVKDRSLRIREGSPEVKQWIDELYKQAERYYEEGLAEEAENELNEVYSLYPSYGDDKDRKKEEQENEKRAEARILRAREFLQVGDFDAAENEINRIFHIFPLHLEAQRIAQEIEDKRAEEKCMHRLTQARTFFLKGSYDKAEAELKEIFNVLPHLANAEILARQIEAAKQRLKWEEREHHIHELVDRGKKEKDQRIQDVENKSGKESETRPAPVVSPGPGEGLHILPGYGEDTKHPPEKTAHEVEEIQQLFPHYQDPGQRQKKDEEKKNKEEELLSKAQKFFVQENLESAEEALNSIFQFSPLHPGALQMLMRIENIRYQKEMEERSKKIEKATQVTVAKEDNYIKELLEKGHAQLKAGQFEEVMFTLHDLFKLDPNHAGARQLQAALLKAKEEKAERRRDEAKQKEQELRVAKAAIASKRKAEQAPRKPNRTKPQHAQGLNKLSVRIAVGCIVVCVFCIACWRTYRYFYPKSVSIAVLNYISIDRETKDAGITEILSAWLKDDFSRCGHVTVAASLSPKALDPKTFIFSKSHAPFTSQYFLAGNIQHQRNQYTVTTVLIDVASRQTEHQIILTGDLTALPKIRTAIVRSILQYLDIDSEVAEIPATPCSNEGYQKYLSAYGLIRQGSLEALDSARILLRQCQERNKNFTAAEVLLARAELNTYALGSGNVQLWNETMSHAQHALTTSANAADAYRIIGECYYFAQRFDLVLKNVNASLELQPAHGQSYRDLARAYIGTGDYDAAFMQASAALNVEPVNGESYLSMGLVKQCQKDYGAASEYYQKAIQWGLNDSLITSLYLMPLWSYTDHSDKILAFWKEQLNRWPNDYRIYYFIGHAYQKVLNVSIEERASLYNGSFTEGLRLANQVLESNADDPLAHAYAALFYSRLGSFQDGDAEIQKAIELDSTSATIHYLAADVYSIQKDVPRALVALQHAVAIKYELSELFNPDLTQIKDEPGFTSIVTKPLQSSVK